MVLNFKKQIIQNLHTAIDVNTVSKKNFRSMSTEKSVLLDSVASAKEVVLTRVCLSVINIIKKVLCEIFQVMSAAALMDVCAF